jgi:uncharacterized protein with PIN domain
MAVPATQANIARKAFRRYGRGRHAANLNFGDCFAHALANGHGQVDVAYRSWYVSTWLSGLQRHLIHIA